MMFSSKIGFFYQQGGPAPQSYYFSLYPGYTYITSIAPVNTGTGIFDGTYLATGYTSNTDTPSDAGLLYYINVNGTYNYVTNYEYSGDIAQHYRSYSQASSGGNPCKSGQLTTLNKIFFAASVLATPNSGYAVYLNTGHNNSIRDAKWDFTQQYNVIAGEDNGNGIVFTVNPGGPNINSEYYITDTTVVNNLGIQYNTNQVAFNADNIAGPDYVSSGVLSGTGAGLISRVLLQNPVENITAQAVITHQNRVLSSVSGTTSHDSYITEYNKNTGNFVNQFIISNTELYDGVQQFYCDDLDQIFFMGYKFVGGDTYGVIGQMDIVGGNLVVIWANELYCPGYNFTPTFMNVDILNDIIYVCAETDYNGVPSSVVVRLPTDGSQTGTYGIFEYAATTVTVTADTTIVHSLDATGTTSPGASLTGFSWTSVTNLSPTQTTYTL